jgi:hypothetical protein
VQTSNPVTRKDPKRSAKFWTKVLRQVDPSPHVREAAGRDEQSLAELIDQAQRLTSDQRYGESPTAWVAARFAEWWRDQLSGSIDSVEEIVGRLRMELESYDEADRFTSPALLLDRLGSKLKQLRGRPGPT